MKITENELLLIIEEEAAALLQETIPDWYDWSNHQIFNWFHFQDFRAGIPDPFVMSGAQPVLGLSHRDFWQKLRRARISSIPSISAKCARLKHFACFNRGALRQIILLVWPGLKGLPGALENVINYVAFEAKAGVALEGLMAEFSELSRSNRITAGAVTRHKVLMEEITSLRKQLSARWEALGPQVQKAMEHLRGAVAIRSNARGNLSLAEPDKRGQLAVVDPEKPTVPAKKSRLDRLRQLRHLSKSSGVKKSVLKRILKFIISRGKKL